MAETTSHQIRQPADAMARMTEFTTFGQYQMMMLQYNKQIEYETASHIFNETNAEVEFY